MTPEEAQAKIDELTTALTAANSEAANRRKTAGELKDELAKFDGVDPVKFKELQTKAAGLEQDRLKQEGKFEEALAEALRGKEAELEAVKALLATQNTEMSTMKIDNEFNMGLNGGAINNAQTLMLAKSNIKMEDGVAVVYNGDAPMVDTTTGKRVAVKDYAVKFLADNPHLAKPGAPGSGSQGNSGGTNNDSKAMPRADYDQLDQGAKNAHCASGGTIVD